jgi:hypothetical protein
MGPVSLWKQTRSEAELLPTYFGAGISEHGYQLVKSVGDGGVDARGARRGSGTFTLNALGTSEARRGYYRRIRKSHFLHAVCLHAVALSKRVRCRGALAQSGCGLTNVRESHRSAAD